MPEFRVNTQGMERCCYMTLQFEMKRRQDAGETLHVEGDKLICSTCNAEMICNSDGQSGKLRWRWKGAEK